MNQRVSSATFVRSRRFGAGRPSRIRIDPGDVLRATALVVLLVVLGLPVYVTFASAVLPTGALVQGGLIPDLGRLTLDNIVDAAGAIPLAQQYLTSIAVVTLQTAAQFLFACLAAYALIFPQWRARGLAFGFIIATLAVPGEALTIPNYELVSALGLRDTILGVVVPFLAVGYPIFLLRQAFDDLPREVWEAARLDGCGDLRALFAVILPMCRPQATTAIMWSALAAWNGFFWPLLITDSPENRTVQVGLAQLVRSEATSPAVIFAGTALVLVPTVLLVIFSQRFLVSGMARGVLK